MSLLDVTVTFFENGKLSKDEDGSRNKIKKGFQVETDEDEENDEDNNSEIDEENPKNDETENEEEQDETFQEAIEDEENRNEVDKDEKETRQKSNQTPVRKSERKWKPVICEGYVSYYTTQEYPEEPETVEEALEGPDKKQWKLAMKREYEALKKNETWKWVPEPTDKKILTAKWIFKKKSNEVGNEKFKARLVVRGCAQKSGIDYNDTYSPVVKYSTLRYLLSLAAKEDFEISHMDVTTAYLNGNLEEDIYVRPPEEIKEHDNPGGVWKLKKAMYGLKQSGRAWNKRFDDVLKQHGLEKSKFDPCI